MGSTDDEVNRSASQQEAACTSNMLPSGKRNKKRGKTVAEDKRPVRPDGRGDVGGDAPLIDLQSQAAKAPEHLNLEVDPTLEEAGASNGRQGGDMKATPKSRLLGEVVVDPGRG